VVFACFVMAALMWGFGFYGHGFYLAELQRSHGWPTSLIAGASTLYYLFSALLVVFISDAIRRFGVRACTLTGAFTLAGSVAALPFITEPWQLVAAYLVMAFAWATMSLGAINNILGLWFERKRGLAISLALNGASFGGIVIVPALVFLSGATSFATAMLAGAALVLALMLPVASPSSGHACRARWPADRDGLPPKDDTDRATRRARTARPPCAASPSGTCRGPSPSPSRRKRASSFTRSPSWSRRSGVMRPASPSPSPPAWPSSGASCSARSRSGSTSARPVPCHSQRRRRRWR
jgi:MFS family permease